MAKAKLTITFDPEKGNINVEHPTDLMLSLGLLGFAQSNIYSKINWGESKENKVIPFKGPLPPMPPGKM